MNGKLSASALKAEMYSLTVIFVFFFDQSLSKVTKGLLEMILCRLFISDLHIKLCLIIWGCLNSLIICYVIDLDFILFLMLRLAVSCLSPNHSHIPSHLQK